MGMGLTMTTKERELFYVIKISLQSPHNFFAGAGCDESVSGAVVAPRSHARNFWVLLYLFYKTL